MSIPFLPGNSFSNPRKVDHKKSHHFGFKNGSVTVARPTVGDAAAVDTATERLLEQSSALRTVAYDPLLTFGTLSKSPAKKDQYVPAFVALDGKQLHYDAYFKETVPESQVETFRVRKVKIHYFLEDDSISVTEQHTPNSALPQGTLVRRHRIPNQAEGRFYTVHDLVVGNEVTFYSRVYRITDASDFTREYMASVGVDAGHVEDVPQDKYAAKRELQLAQTQRVSVADPARLKLKKFLETSGRVLRFFCIWDDRENMFGEVRPLVLHFFLADETAEVLDVHRNNSGRDPFPVFLRRRRMPKVFRGVVTDSEQTGDWYKEEDFVVGETINILGRNLLIYDADDTTKQYYTEKYGITTFNVITQVEEPRSKPMRELPPPTGFGTEEDSLASFYQLIPKPPKKDFKKIMMQDGKVLRFAARILTDRPEDAERRFTLSYFLSDDTLLIYEPPVRNSGVVGGKFMERSRVRNDETGDYFKAQDLFIGGQVSVLRRRFVLYDADDYALKFMEENADVFPQSNIRLIINKLRAAVTVSGKHLEQELQSSDPSGTLTLAELRKGLERINNTLSDQELITLFRRFDTQGEGLVKASEVMAALAA